MDVEICPSGGDIELCLERDIELCTGCDALSLSGDDEMDVGEVYTASGGSGTLTFTFDGGTISSTDTTCTITGLNSCSGRESRLGTITVTDSCTPDAQSADITGRLHSGIWMSYKYLDGYGCERTPTAYAIISGMITGTAWSTGTECTPGQSVWTAGRNTCCWTGEEFNGSHQIRLNGTWQIGFFLNGDDLVRESLYVLAGNEGNLWSIRCNSEYGCTSAWCAEKDYTKFKASVNSCVKSHDMGLHTVDDVWLPPGTTINTLTTGTDGYDDDDVVSLDQYFYKWVCD